MHRMAFGKRNILKRWGYNYERQKKENTYL